MRCDEFNCDKANGKALLPVIKLRPPNAGLQKRIARGGGGGGGGGGGLFRLIQLMKYLSYVGIQVL